MENIDKKIRIEMPDQSYWEVPAMAVALDRAKHYADEFGGDIQRSLNEDTIPYFNEHEYEILDWASGNMNWDDVKSKAVKVERPEDKEPVDYQEGWVNGEKELV